MRVKLPTRQEIDVAVGHRIALIQAEGIVPEGRELPTGYWGDVKTVLVVLAANACWMLLDGFTDIVRYHGPIDAFYVDDRIRLRRAESAYSLGTVGRRELTKSLRALVAAQEAHDLFTRNRY